MFLLLMTSVLCTSFFYRSIMKMSLIASVVASCNTNRFFRCREFQSVGLTSERCRSSQELSEIGTPCHLTKPAWTHLKLLKLQSVSNKPPRLLLFFNLFLTYPDARLPLMHSTYLNQCMIFDTTKEAVNRQKQKQSAGKKTPQKLNVFFLVKNRRNYRLYDI